MTISFLSDFQALGNAQCWKIFVCLYKHSAICQQSPSTTFPPENSYWPKTTQNQLPSPFCGGYALSTLLIPSLQHTLCSLTIISSCICCFLYGYQLLMKTISSSLHLCSLWKCMEKIVKLCWMTKRFLDDTMALTIPISWRKCIKF